MTDVISARSSMNEDGDETQPADPSRTTLAASTLRALRAGTRGTRTPSAPVEEETPGEASDVVLPVTEPAESEIADETVEIDTVDADVVEAGTVPVELTKAEPAGDAAVAEQVAEPPVLDTPVGTRVAPATTRSRRSSLLTAACAVLAAAALVFAVVAGIVWWTAGHSAQHRLGVAREQVSKDAQLAITTVNTSDYRHPSAALSNWLDASTGSLHSQFSQSRTAAVKLLAQAETVTKATVLDEAVTSIDLSKGTASVIASVNVTRIHDGSTSTVRNRFRATMTRVGGQWKLSNLAVVAVSLS